MPACGEVSTHNPNAYIQYMPTACLQTPRASANAYTASSGIVDLNRDKDYAATDSLTALHESPRQISTKTIFVSKGYSFVYGALHTWTTCVL